MKKSKNFLLFAILTTILFCTAICQAQIKAEEVQINERLPDGSVILTIDGVKYRALTVDQLRKIQEMSVNYQSTLQTNEILQLQNQSLKATIQKITQDLAVAGTQISNETKRGDEYRRLYEEERRLRIAAEKLPQKKNVLEKIFNSPITQIVLVGVAGVIASKQK